MRRAQESAPTLYQSIDLVVFQSYALSFSSSVLTRGDEWLTLTERADTAHAAAALTETAAPDPATPEAVRRGKINSNREQPKEGQTASPSPPANQDSDATLVASIGESDNKSDYVYLGKKSPTSPANMPDLALNIIKLE